MTIKTITYPPWAPASLCERHRELRSNLPNLEKSARADLQFFRLWESVLHRLLTWECMRYGWREVRRHFPLCPSRPASASYIYREEENFLLHVALDALRAVIDARKPYKTRAATSEQYLRIADLARELMREIGDAPLDTDRGGVFRLLPDEAISGLLARLNPVFWDGDWCELPVGEYSRMVTTSGQSWPLPVRTEISASLRHYLAMSHVDWPARLVDDPPVSGMLSRLAVLADQAARDAISADRIIERDTGNREAVIFIRTLAKNFHSYFGEALRGTLANFATAALGGDDVSKGDVDSALRGFDFSAP